ncbi:hypothetical protein [Methylobacterium sp. SyP6R]|uniref:hypothetical protein n=1 Tax=Methylobacterium sp. SyP6R TaxID=2718876 RepID=UPI001F1E8402|nr:hypothetical protein [Methylobacterium sp. SyP6R]MCF4125007.1 hypothetical protein [Methylobacterium sp. SyP6R]
MAPLRDLHARDLSAYEPEPVTVGYGEDVAGRGDLGNQIVRLVSRALRDASIADIPRAEVARRMAEYLGREVRVATLDKWASAAAVEHRIPFDAYVALVHATGRHDLLGFPASLFGYAVVPASYIDMIELQQLEEHAREVAARKAALEAKIAGRR